MKKEKTIDDLDNTKDDFALTQETGGNQQQDPPTQNKTNKQQLWQLSKQTDQ